MGPGKDTYGTQGPVRGEAVGDPQRAHDTTSDKRTTRSNTIAEPKRWILSKNLEKSKKSKKYENIHLERLKNDRKDDQFKNTE